MQIRHVVSKAELLHVIRPRALIPVHQRAGLAHSGKPHLVDHLQFATASQHEQTSVDARERLDGVEAEHADVGEAADGSPLVTRTKGVRRVVNHSDAMLFGEMSDARVVAQQASVIGNDHGLGLCRDQGLGLIQIGAQGLVVDVAEDRRRPSRQNGLKIRYVVERRRDHFVARAYAGRQKREVQRRMARAHGRHETVSSPQIALHGLLELVDVAPHARASQAPGPPGWPRIPPRRSMA